MASTRLAELLAGTPQLDGLSPALVRASRQRRSELARLGASPSRRRALGRWMARGLRRYLIREWTFTELGDAAERRIDALYLRLVDETLGALVAPTPWAEAERGLRAAVAGHQSRLRRLVGELVGAPGGSSPAGAALPSPPICHEYEPALQLAVLGVVAPETLAGPVLDLGCGERAALVRLLRVRGVPALGLDRLAPAEPGLLRGSWLDVELPPGRFGTVLSHQAFTLHFLHAHLRSGPAAELYARRYMGVLRALRPGGAFLYAPALPFVERHLDPERFAVRTRPLPVPRPDAGWPAALAAAVGEGFAAATVIRRAP